MEGKSESKTETKLANCDEKGCSYQAKSKGAITTHWNKAHRKPRGQKRGGYKRKKERSAYKKTPEVVSLLLAAFDNGLTVTDACHYAGISRDAFYEWKNADQEFSDKVRRSQAKLGFKARELIAQDIYNGEVKTAQWWLERKAKDEYSLRRELTGDDGQPLEFQPIQVMPSVKGPEK